MDPLASVRPEPGETRGVMLTALVAAGDQPGVRRVLEADPGSVNEPGLDGTTPLCAAAMWGHTEILRLLLERAAAPGLQNEHGPKWTALHAAALQEEGKACMLLLDFKADPRAKDVEGVTPCDYASCSEALWPLFAARGCQRVAKASLVEKGVLRKASSRLEQQLQLEAAGDGEDFEAPPARRGIIAEYSRPGSSYVVSREFPARPGSVAGRYPPAVAVSGPIDILQEEEDKDVGKAATGLRSLGI